MPKLLRALLLASLAFAAAGCDVYDRPNRPVPGDFRARLLDGTVVDRQTFDGKPWVVNVWVPG
ncbi:MAG: hypothetical protein ACYC8T_01460 [Myxococcaceae bacterium]